MKTISYGILIFKEVDNQTCLFMAHSTNNTFWDIPKGGAELGESPEDTVLRELKEETGFHLSNKDIIDIGLFPYNSKKDLHLFIASKDLFFDEKKAICTSCFDFHGKSIPEVDDFKFIPLKDVENVCAKSFQKTFKLLMKKIFA